MVHFFSWSSRKHIESHHHMPEKFHRKVKGQEGFLVNGFSVKMERLTEWLGRFIATFAEGRKVFIHDLCFFKTVIVSVGLLLQCRPCHFKSEFSPHFSFPSSASFHTKPVKLPLCGGWSAWLRTFPSPWKKRWCWTEAMASGPSGLCWLICSSTKQAQLLAGWFVLLVEETTWLMLLKYLEAVILYVGGFLLLQATGRLSLRCPLVFPLPYVQYTLVVLQLRRLPPQLRSVSRAAHMHTHGARG